MTRSIDYKKFARRTRDGFALTRRAPAPVVIIVDGADVWAIEKSRFSPTEEQKARTVAISAAQFRAQPLLYLHRALFGHPVIIERDGEFIVLIAPPNPPEGDIQLAVIKSRCELLGLARISRILEEVKTIRETVRHMHECQQQDQAQLTKRVDDIATSVSALRREGRPNVAKDRVAGEKPAPAKGNGRA